MGGANSRNQEKGTIFFRAWVCEILKKGKILHVFSSIWILIW